MESPIQQQSVQKKTSGSNPEALASVGTRIEEQLVKGNASSAEKKTIAATPSASNASENVPEWLFTYAEPSLEEIAQPSDIYLPYKRHTIQMLTEQSHMVDFLETKAA